MGGQSDHETSPADGRQASSKRDLTVALLIPCFSTISALKRRTGHFSFDWISILAIFSQPIVMMPSRLRPNQGSCL